MLAIVVGIWTVDCFLVGLDLDRVQPISSNQSQLLGVIIFNFAFVTSVPSWVNEKVSIYQLRTNTTAANYLYG